MHSPVEADPEIAERLRLGRIKGVSIIGIRYRGVTVVTRLDGSQDLSEGAGTDDLLI
jgi:hypothetical protein